MLPEYKILYHFVWDNTLQSFLTKSFPLQIFLYNLSFNLTMLRAEKIFNFSTALDADREKFWPNEYKSDHHIWIVQLPPWPKETIFMVIYLILCVVRIVNVMTKKNLKQLLFCFWALENDLLLEKISNPEVAPFIPQIPDGIKRETSESCK